MTIDEILHKRFVDFLDKEKRKDEHQFMIKTFNIGTRADCAFLDENCMRSEMTMTKLIDPAEKINEIARYYYTHSDPCYSVTTMTMDNTRGLKATVDAETPPILRRKDIRPTLIKIHGRKTFVTWNDDTQTVVKCEYPKEPDPFAAFCAAYAKKMFGSTTKVLEAINQADEKEIRKRKHAANKAMNDIKQERMKEQFKRDVERRRYWMAVERKAIEKENEHSEL